MRGLIAQSLRALALGPYALAQQVQVQAFYLLLCLLYCSVCSCFHRPSAHGEGKNKKGLATLKKKERGFLLLKLIEVGVQSNLHNNISKLFNLKTTDY